jgi:transposase-like protein
MPSFRAESLVTRRRWTPEEARSVLDAVERSGSTIRAFALAHGLDPQRLYQWRCRLGKAEPTTFREITVRPTTSVAEVRGSGAFEVALASGAVVRVPESFDGEALARLLDVLSRVRPC